jgi:excisionase family DNA binding protein
MIPLLTVKQFATAVGLSPKTVRQKVWRREIEYIKIGRSVRFSQAMVQKLIDAGTVPVVTVKQDGVKRAGQYCDHGPSGTED